MKERKWFVEYKNSGGYGEGMEVEGASEHDAILNVVDFLREDCDFITQLINVEEIIDDEEQAILNAEDSNYPTGDNRKDL